MVKEFDTQRTEEVKPVSNCRSRLKEIGMRFGPALRKKTRPRERSSEEGVKPSIQRWRTSNR